MSLNAKQKRAALQFAEPFLRIFYFIHRLVTFEVFRDHSIPIIDVKPGREKTGRKVRILVVRMDTIGDVLLSEPAIAALRRRFPGAQIDVLVGSAGRAILAGNPNVSSFVVYNAPWHAAWRGQAVNWQLEIVKLIAIIRQLRRQHYDLAFELRGDLRDITFMSLLGVRATVGNGWRGGGFMLDHDVKVDVDAHRVDFALGIVAITGAKSVAEPPKIYFGEDERKHAARLLPDSMDKEYVVLHLGAGFASKCLPIERFAAVSTALVTNRISKREIVVIGGPDEAPTVEDFVSRLPFEPLNLAGKLNLLETAAVLERASLFIGNDSGPMHIAASTGSPVVTFFGPSEPLKYHPFGTEYRLLELDLNCRPCDHVHCIHDDNICLTGIRTDEIVSAAEELLAKREGQAGVRGRGLGVGG